MGEKMMERCFSEGDHRTQGGVVSIIPIECSPSSNWPPHLALSEGEA